MLTLKKQLRDTEAILEISRAMMVEKNLNRLLNLIVTRTSEILNAERSFIFIVDYDTKELWTQTSEEPVEIRIPWDKGIVGYVVQSREIVNITDAYKDARFNPEVDYKTDYQIKSILCAPLINHKNEVTGALQILNKKSGAFNEYDKSLIMTLAAQAAVAIENVQLYQEIELTLKRFIKTLAATVDERDPATASHSERVARYALNIGQSLGLNEEELKILEYAAYLHDVGKISIRDEILLKPSQFTPAEFDQMKQHVIKTRNILERIFVSRTFRKIPDEAAAHHEKLNGSGYAAGLKGDQLSRTVRILAVADVFDALVAGERPYKKAISIDEALSILEAGAGTQFDAEIVHIFKKQKLYEIERRQSTRINITIPVSYSISSNDDKKVLKVYGQGQSLNISLDGMLILTDRYIPSETKLNLQLSLPKETFYLTSKVMRTEKLCRQGEYKVAVEFTNLSPTERHKLDGYLNRL